MRYYIRKYGISPGLQFHVTEEEGHEQMRLPDCFRKFIEGKYFIHLGLLLLVFQILNTVVSEGKPFIHQVLRYTYAHYLLSYELGFIPRGLVGTCFNYIAPFLSAITFQIAVFLLTAVCYVLLARKFLQLLQKSENRLALLLIGFFLFALPTTFLPFADLGRYDLYLFMLMFLCIFIIRQPPDKQLRWLLPALLITGNLIHEVFLFLYAPTILAYLSWKLNWKSLQEKSIFALCLAGLLLSAAALCHAQTKMPSGAELDRLIQENDVLCIYPAQELTLAVYSSQNFFSHLRHVQGFYLDTGKPFGIMLIISLFSMAPAWLYLGIFWKILIRKIRKCGKMHPIQLLFFLLAAQSAFSMFVIGTDLCRWAAAVFWCNILTIILLLCDSRLSLRLTRLPRRFVSFSVVLSFLYLLMGPANIFGFSKAGNWIAILIFDILNNL